MVFVILIGAALFSLVFRGLGGDDMVHDFLRDMPGGVLGAMIVVMGVMFFLGFFLDFIEIIFVVVPIVAPALLLMGLDPVWLGVHDRGQPADQLPDAAVRLRAVLPARRRAALGDVPWTFTGASSRSWSSRFSLLSCWRCSPGSRSGCPGRSTAERKKTGRPLGSARLRSGLPARFRCS